MAATWSVYRSLLLQVKGKSGRRAGTHGLGREKRKQGAALFTVQPRESLRSFGGVDNGVGAGEQSGS